MTRLFALILGICLLRRGPQDLPYSVGLTRGLVLLGVGADLLFVQFAEGGDDGLLRVAFSLLLTLGVPWAILRSQGKGARYAQTLAAYAGTGVLFTLLFLPVAIKAQGLPMPDPELPPTRDQLIVGWTTLLLVGWKLAINGHIWKHALDWPRIGGLLLAAGVFLLELGLVRWLFAPVAQ